MASRPSISTDQRRAPRIEIALGGAVVAGPRRFPAMFVNISAHGAMAEIGQRLLPGRPVLVELGDLAPLRARVVWAHDGHLGLAFDAELSVEAMLGLC